MSNAAPTPSDHQSNQSNPADDLSNHDAQISDRVGSGDRQDEQDRLEPQLELNDHPDNQPDNPGKSRSRRSRRSRRAKKHNPIADWLERRFCVPEFAGGMLLALSIFFFAAATNTLAGWLYVISGVSFALLLIGAVMPARIIKEIEVVRSPLEPASAGDMATVEVKFINLSRAQKELLRLRDMMPSGLADRDYLETVIESLPPRRTLDRAQNYTFTWTYSFITRRRGVYTLSEVQIVTASPLGLFRSRRSHFAAQRLVVYPTVLPLKQCPIIDQIGSDDSPRQYHQEFTYKNSTEGITRALRPYRWGDPIRLVHWRTSARFGDLRIRELEVTLGGQELVIALDLQPGWLEWEFERAVVAAASLFFYAQSLGLKPSLWTATDGIISQTRSVLETLARVQVIGASSGSRTKKTSVKDATNSDLELATPPDLPMIWLTHRAETIARLPVGSRWLLWQSDDLGVANPEQYPGMVIAPLEGVEGSPDESFRTLQTQLQAPLKHAAASI
jgi:uncharacterized protein (DUF58 family)